MLKHAPTLDDVAKYANVSTATVSRCINTPDQVRKPTRERVQAAISELGYTPHFGGMALASNRTNTIGAVIPTMENAIFARGLQVLQEELSAAGVTLLVSTSLYDSEQEAHQIRALVARGVDGIVLIGDARSDEIYEFLRNRNIPFVLMWTHDTDLHHCYVGFDNKLAAESIAHHVVKLGHRKIGMISGITKDNDRARARVQGVKDVLAHNGIPLKPPNLIEVPYSLEDGRLAALELLSRQPRPTAVFFGNDVQAAGALKAARQLNLDVPNDVSIIGFDDIDLASAVEPALTTVHVPHRRMGREAAHMILRMARDKTAGESVLLKTNIVERASLAKCKQAD